jgi:hypothetical protein
LICPLTRRHLGDILLLEFSRYPLRNVLLLELGRYPSKQVLLFCAYPNLFIFYHFNKKEQHAAIEAVDDYFPQKERPLSVDNDSDADDNLPFDGQESYQINDRQNSGGKITAFNRPDGKWVCYCSSHPEPRCYKNKNTLRAHYARASKKHENLKWKVSNA